MKRWEYISVFAAIHALLDIGEVGTAERILEGLMKEAETKDDNDRS